MEEELEKVKKIKIKNDCLNPNCKYSTLLSASFTLSASNPYSYISILLVSVFICLEYIQTLQLNNGIASVHFFIRVGTLFKLFN